MPDQPRFQFEGLALYMHRVRVRYPPDGNEWLIRVRTVADR